MHQQASLYLLGLLLLWGAACERQKTSIYATTVTVYHIAPGKNLESQPDGSFLGYPILSGPVELAPQEARQIENLLNDTSSYHQLDDAFKMCLFTPNVGLRLEREEQAHLEVLLSFDCNVLKIYEYGQEVFSEDFDPGRTEFLEVFYPLFKNMPYFQALKNT